MYNAIRALLLVLLFVQAEPFYAQRLGLLPSHVKWQQLRNDSLRIIYPKGSEARAERVASLMCKLAKADPIASDSRYKPISIILQPQTNVSNGYVGLAPYVSEFYLEPHENPFELGSLPWEDLLAIHEYRHVQQVNAANNGISHLVKLIFGDIAFSGVYALSVPVWYREGDAVYAESKWTPQGRGRLSYFSLPFYQKEMEGHPWPYYKARNGSYKIFTPDNYQLGYLLVQYGNHIFGETTWDTIMHNAPRYKYVFEPFSGLVKENYGQKTKGLYLDAIEFYGDQWTANIEPDIIYPLVPISEKDKDNTWFDMTYPDVDHNGNLYAAITTFDYTTGLFKLSANGDREKIKSTGFQKDSYFDYSHGKLVWTELRYDPRWIRKDKNVIVVLDEQTQHKKSIEPEKGYFTPSLNQAGDKIVALHAAENGHYNLRIIDAVSGKVLTELPNEENLYLGYPVFSEDEQHIIATARNQHGQMCLVEQTIMTGEIRLITHYSYAILGRPALHGDQIFLTAGLSTVDQVYAVDRNDGIFYQVSGGRSSHFDPVWDPVHNDLVCSEYRLDGKKLVRLPGDPRQWHVVNLEDGIKDLAGSTGRNLMDEEINVSDFTTKKYSAWANAINPHSWVVTASDPFYGVEIRSNNILNTVSIAAGYEVNRVTRANGPYINAVFGMWFPQFDLGFSNLRQEVKLDDGTEASTVNNKLSAGVALPLVFSPGVYYQNLTISTHYNTGVGKLDPKIEGHDQTNYNYADIRMLLISRRKQGYRQPMPSFGQRLEFSYSHELSGIPIEQLYSAGDLVLPAMKPSHFLLLQGEVLFQDIKNGAIVLRGDYIGARGFAYNYGQRQYKIGITYGFPVLYPDRGFGNVLYTRRIRLQPFFDYAYTSDDEVSDHIRSSVGTEVIFDMRFPPLSIGFRYSRLISGYEDIPDRIEFFIPSMRF